MHSGGTVPTRTNAVSKAKVSPELRYLRDLCRMLEPAAKVERKDEAGLREIISRNASEYLLTKYPKGSNVEFSNYCMPNFYRGINILKKDELEELEAIFGDVAREEGLVELTIIAKKGMDLEVLKMATSVYLTKPARHKAHFRTRDENEAIIRIADTILASMGAVYCK